MSGIIPQVKGHRGGPTSGWVTTDPPSSLQSNQLISPKPADAVLGMRIHRLSIRDTSARSDNPDVGVEKSDRSQLSSRVH